jgi:biopolymer transport protein ExbD
MPLKLQHDEQPQLNLTPMIDVLFLLIIFFMVASTFGDLERSLDLKVPEVANAGESPTPARPLVINVHPDGHIEFEDQTVTIEELVARLASIRSGTSDPSVVIRGDAACPFQHVAAALAACRAAQISELGITVRTASLTGGPTVQ